jgi:hypothetical protein
MRLSGWIAVAAPIGLLACGGSSPRQSHADGAAGSPPGDGAATDTVVVATVASNGARIPAPDPEQTCGAFDIKVASCVQGTTCPRVQCDCRATDDPSDPTTLKFDFDPGFGCTPVGCISSISCSVACDVRQRYGNEAVLLTVGGCFGNGLCTKDQDCEAGHVCLRLPGQSGGKCTNRRPGADCFTDFDCDGAPCVVFTASQRTCGSGPEGAACNLDSHCHSGRCLFASTDTSLGVCADGTNDDRCFHGGDCKAGLRCLGNMSFSACSDGSIGSVCASVDDCQSAYACAPAQDGNPSPTGRTCSTGEEGAPCKVAEDCKSSICVSDALDRGTCSNGGLGARCQSPDQCLSGFCPGFVGKCTTGAVGAACYRDEDCANAKCGELGCTDGALGHSCRNTAQCAAGLHCSAVPGGVCVSPAANGTTCTADVDCQSGHCRQVADTPFLACAN